jgi:hypothetical protein
VAARERVETIDLVVEYVTRNGLSSAELVADGIGKDRTTVQRLLANDRRFYVEKRGRAYWYGLEGMG